MGKLDIDRFWTLMTMMTTTMVENFQSLPTSKSGPRFFNGLKVVTR